MKYKPGDKIYYYVSRHWNRNRARVSSGTVSSVRTSDNGRILAYELEDSVYLVKTKNVIGPEVDLREPEYSFQVDSCEV